MLRRGCCPRRDYHPAPGKAISDIRLGKTFHDAPPSRSPLVALVFLRRVCYAPCRRAEPGAPAPKNHQHHAMFTGLVEALGTVKSIEPRGEQARLSVAVPFAPELSLGDSIAVNGCCLTADGIDTQAGTVSFDLLLQTLRVTSLGHLREGSDVNLERALRIGDRLGGHFVQGHVDATGTLKVIEPRGQDHHLVVELPDSILRYCIDKGSLSLDGISLTIAELDGNLAEFWITPHTFEVTNLRSAAPGQPMNLEADLLAKHIERLLEASKEER